MNKVLYAWVVLLFLSSLGCDSGRDQVGDAGRSQDTNHSGSSDAALDGPRAEVVCEGLSEEDCRANIPNGCEPLVGWTGEDSTPAHHRYAGCRTSGYGSGYWPCSTAISCGINPATAECWGFLGACTPDGWISSFDSAAWPTDCAQRIECPSHCRCQP